MGNDYLDFYGEQNISPVNQNIDDIKIHYERRRKLYRQCGVPVLAFRNAEILEIGPGGGYNTLAFFHWQCKHVDLVEANPKGIEDIGSTFRKQNIPDDKYRIFQCKIEDYVVHKKYDFIIAEGFLPFLSNQQEVIHKLQSLVKNDGIVVITCVDHVSCFIESMKRLFGQILIKGISSYEDRVRYLSKLFEPQLEKLKGVSRTTEDWVQDNILNPAASNKMALSIGQSICFFNKEFDILGTSPQMFTDYSWYKDIWHDYKKDYQQQFQEKHMSLLMAGMQEQTLQRNQAEILEKQFECIRKLAADYEKKSDINDIRNILAHMNAIGEKWKNMDERFRMVFGEIHDALLCVLETGKVNMENYPHFFAAFGRSQQYIAFIKKFGGE